MTDLISREAALAAVMHMSDAYERIYVLPAAQVKVKPLVWRESVGPQGVEWNAFCALLDKGWTAYSVGAMREIDAVRAARVLAALDLSPSPVDAIQTPDPVVSASQVICTWPSCSHTAKGQCQPLSPTAVVASQTPDPVVNAPAENATVKGETAGQMLDRLGMDGAMWAAEFRTTALQLGYSDMDEGWLIGWFCNAIMAGYDRASDPVLSDPRVKALVELLREANDDLKAYVDADWPKEQRAQYPSYQRKWERDMELCKRIDAALSDVKDFLTADPLSDPRVKATEERLAFVLWKAEADRAAPNVGRTRTQEAFAEQLPQTREQWLGLARAALRAIGGEA